MGFSYLWRSSVGAPSLNIYCLCYKEKPCLVILEGMAGSSDGVPPLNRVFSSSLDPSKTWYALNTALCSCKPETFCSSSSAKLFADEYHPPEVSCSGNRSPAFFSGERDFDIEEPVKIWSVVIAVLTYEYSTDFAMLFSPAKNPKPAKSEATEDH